MRKTLEELREVSPKPSLILILIQTGTGNMFGPKLTPNLPTLLIIAQTIDILGHSPKQKLHFHLCQI